MCPRFQIPCSLAQCPGSGALSDPNRILCRCLQVTVGEVATAALAWDLENVRQVMQQTEAGAGCTACHGRIREVLAAVEDDRGAPALFQQDVA